MKSVALVGMGQTREQAVRTQADEVWTLNHSYAYLTLPRIDRLFDVHPWWKDAPRMEGKPKYAGMLEHWRNLQSVRMCPVYMLEQRVEVPMSKPYPIHRVTQYIFGMRLLYGGDPSDFYKSTFDYMIALAIMERFDVIESYGFEMGSRTEYKHQRQSAAFFIGFAIGKGITYRLPKGSTQLPRGRYMYDGGKGEMVYRQTLENELAEYQNQLKSEPKEERRLWLKGAIDALKAVIEELDLEEE